MLIASVITSRPRPSCQITASIFLIVQAISVITCPVVDVVDLKRPVQSFIPEGAVGSGYGSSGGCGRGSSGGCGGCGGCRLDNLRVVVIDAGIGTNGGPIPFADGIQDASIPNGRALAGNDVAIFDIRICEGVRVRIRRGWCRGGWGRKGGVSALIGTSCE